MPIEALVFYLQSKHEHETRRDNYMMDCLWAMAVDRRFVKDKKPDLPRWFEVNLSTTKAAKKPMSADEILNAVLKH
jgi:hypothetical protein